MAIGAGKYDKECVEILQKVRACAVALIVIEGDRGSGASLDIRPELAMKLYPKMPVMLRALADEIDRELSPNVGD